MLQYYTHYCCSVATIHCSFKNLSFDATVNLGVCASIEGRVVALHVLLYYRLNQNVWCIWHNLFALHTVDGDSMILLAWLHLALSFATKISFFI